jgi:hypothetical protein
MKKWYTSFSVVVVSLIILFFVIIGFQNLSQFLKSIPWLTILFTLSILIGLGFLIDFVFVGFFLLSIEQIKKKLFLSLLLERWGLFFQTIWRFVSKIENFVLILMIIGGLLFVTTFTIGVVKTCETVSIGVSKAIKYDSAISELRSKYQEKIDGLINENTELKIGIDKQNKLIQDKDDQLFLLDSLNKQLQVEIKRLLPKGAQKSTFTKPLR